MSTPEPSGTRMQVVKGCSEFNCDFVGPNLGPRYAGGRVRRHPVLLHWPKWCGDRWVTYYQPDDAPAVAVINLYPDGRVTLHTNHRDGTPAGTVAATIPGGKTPYEMFSVLHEYLGVPLVEHLRATLKPLPD